MFWCRKGRKYSFTARSVHRKLTAENKPSAVIANIELTPQEAKVNQTKDVKNSKDDSNERLYENTQFIGKCQHVLYTIPTYYHEYQDKELSKLVSSSLLCFS